MKLSDISIIAWIVENRMKTENGAPIDFKDHPFLYDLYTDWHPKIAVKKAAQIGFTVTAFFKLCFAVGKKGLAAIYTLPTADEVRSMVGGKFNRIIAQNPVLLKLVKDHDSIEQKVIGSNVVNFNGTWGEREAISSTSDLNVHDEASRSKQSVLELYDSRQQHSKYQWQWIFSNPASKGDLLDRCWEKSDKKEWHVTCPQCDLEQILTWPDSIDLETEQFVCKGCRLEIDDVCRRKGRWKATGTGEWSGYHISLLIAPWVKASKIIEYAKTQSAEQFANFVLGENYVGSGNTVTEEIFTRNFTDQINSQERPIIGCDSGIKKHFVVGNSQGLFWYGVTEDWEDIARMLKRWPRSVAVLDAMPDITGPRALRERFPGRVFLNHYAKDRKTLRLIRWGEDKEHGSVLSDRNRMLQLVIDEFSDKRIPLQGKLSDWAEFISHWRTLYRQNGEDMVGNQTYEWLTSNGMDHFAHATVYWRIGMDRFAGGDGKIISAQNPVGQIREGSRFGLDGTIHSYLGKPKPMPSLWGREVD